MLMFKEFVAWTSSGSDEVKRKWNAAWEHLESREWVWDRLSMRQKVFTIYNFLEDTGRLKLLSSYEPEDSVFRHFPTDFQEAIIEEFLFQGEHQIEYYQESLKLIYYISKGSDSSARAKELLQLLKETLLAFYTDLIKRGYDAWQEAWMSRNYRYPFWHLFGICALVEYGKDVLKEALKLPYADAEDGMMFALYHLDLADLKEVLRSWREYSGKYWVDMSWDTGSAAHLEKILDKWRSRGVDVDGDDVLGTVSLRVKELKPKMRGSRNS
ncbi:MAG: hypothetical protein ACYCOU_08130 [Sulfobacillus sp.]